MSPRTLVGVACAGDPTDRAAFSGIPAALLQALERLGVQARPIAAISPAEQGVQLALAVTHLRRAQLRKGLKPGLRDALTRLNASPALAALRSHAASRAIRRQGIAACVQYGTAFRLPSQMPFVTYDDMTVLQAERSYPYEWIQRLSRREMRRMVHQQRSVFHAAQACCTTTHWAASSIVDDYDVDPSRVHVVGIGATNLAVEVPERDWSTPRFVFVGKDWVRKNGDAVLRAFATVRAEHPHVTLDVAGGHPPLSADGVRCWGMLPSGDPRLSSLFAGATCFVMPSLHEPAGIAYVEAASAGVGAIGTRSGGATTLIGAGGTVVDPHDDAAITTAMREFCDAERAEMHGRKAADHALLLSWDAVATRLLEVLRDDPMRSAIPPPA